MWQDWVLAVGNWVFLVTLIPAIISSDKPPGSTCVITATTLSIFTITLATLNLSIASLSTGLTAAAWWVLGFQTREK